jgi:hypothetical protein
LVANTIFTSAELKCSRHANKVPCTIWARSFLTWAGRASRAGLGRGRKHAPKSRGEPSRLLTDKRRIPLWSASVRTPHLFHHGIPKVLVNPRSKGITSVQSTSKH